MTTRYRIGQLCFSVGGEHAVAELVRDELTPVRTAEGQPHIRFRFVDTLPVLARATYAGIMRLSAEAYQAEHGGLVYQVRQADDGLDVAVSVAAQGLLRRGPDAVLRMLDWNWLTPEQTVAKNFFYGLLDYTAQLAQLRLGQSWLHASAVERDGVAVALAAWGGVGKTTAMLKLVAEYGWRYLSDDLAAIDEHGMIFRSPKRLQVYGYNVKGQPRLRRALLAPRSLADRAAWHARLAMRGPKLVRRRVSAESLFGGNAVATSAQLDRVLYLERAACDRFEMRPLSAAELSRRAAMTLLHELQPLVTLSTTVHAAGMPAVLPTVTEILECSRDALSRAFANLSPFCVTVPLRATPDDLAAYVAAAMDEVGAAC